MFVGSQNLLKAYDLYLMEHGHTIEELIDKASDCLLPYFMSFKKIALLVGPGNNGADALSLALKLKNNNKEVDLYYVGDSLKFSEGNQYYFNQCVHQHLTMYALDEKCLNDFSHHCNDYDVIGDGFFGFGLNSAPRGMYQGMIDIINQYYQKEVLAIDIPTGLNCNTGIPYSTVLFATKTICLSAMKEGYLNPESAMITGDVCVEELAIDNPFMEAGLFQIVDQEFASKIIKSRQFDGYKNHYGVDLLIVGSHSYRGAAILAAKGAVNAGAGIVKVLSDKSIVDILPTTIPEAIGIVRPTAIRQEDLVGHQAILLGCGIGLDIEAYTLVRDVFQKSTTPLIVDADALTILSSSMSLLRNQNRPIILTPHIGEFKRLTQINEDDDLMEKAQAFACEYHVILVLKGPYTIVTNGKESYRIASGNKAMSVAGMGDTLAGIITAFVGAGYHVMEAVLLGVYVHGMTGDILARKRYSVLPSQLSEHVSQAMYILDKKLKESA